MPLRRPSVRFPALSLALPLALVPFLAPAATLSAQPPKLLAKPDAEFAEPFTNLTALRELKDGRLVAIDVRDKVVQVIDLKSGSATKVGREGSGPGEYALPMRLVALGGDSSAVFDPLNSRLLVVLPNGKAGDFFRIEETASTSSGPGGFRVGMAPPRFTDARGRIYWQAPAIQFREGAPPVESDSAPILRYDRAAKKSDTVAFVRTPKGNFSARGGGNRQEVRIGGANPFAAADEWSVTPDGKVLVIRSPEYRVDVYANGKRTSAPAIPYEKLKLTERHKQQWRDSRKTQTAIMMRVENGRRSASAGPPPANAPDPADWPDMLPPFTQNAVFPAPNGTTWIARTREASDDTPNYDVVDATGKLVGRYELPKDTRVVAVGNGVVYAVRTDEDDLQYLQRFRVQ